MKLLIIKFSSIGDCVMAAHAASAYRRSYPFGKLVWAIDDWCKPVVGTTPIQDPLGVGNHLVDEFYTVPWEEWKANKTSFVTKIRHYLALRRYGFDVAVDLQGHGKTAICLRLCGAKKRLAVDSKDISTLPFAKSAKHPPGLHWVEEQLNTIEQLIPLSDRRLAPMMPVITPEPKGDRALVTISVGSGNIKKNYARFGEVAEMLVKEGHRVAFLGGSREIAPSVEGVEDLVGKLPLVKTMEMLAGSTVHIAADTGSGHISAAYGVPVVSIFGYTDPNKCSPFTENKIVLDAGLKMDGVTPEQVVKAAQRYL